MSARRACGTPPCSTERSPGRSCQLGFFLVEAMRALRNNLATTVAATVTVLIVLYFLGVFVLFGTYLYAKVDKERSGVRVTVYLDKRASPQQITAIGARLRQNPDVKPTASSTSPRPRPGSGSRSACRSRSGRAC